MRRPSSELYRSSGRSPVRFASRASVRGPISSLSWNAKTTSGHPGATRSGAEVDAQQLGRGLAALEPVGDDAQRERLHPRERVLARGLVGERARQVEVLRDPAAVLLALQLDRQMHGLHRPYSEDLAPSVSNCQPRVGVPPRPHSAVARSAETTHSWCRLGAGCIAIGIGLTFGLILFPSAKIMSHFGLCDRGFYRG
jgi:hypothetical protein